MVRFSIFGIPVIVQPFFWVTMVLIGLLWNRGALQTTTPQAFLEIALFTIAGFISILIHELGHALTARKFGATTHIVLESMGGYASYSGVQMSRLRSFIITFAGPAVQIILAVIIGLILFSAPFLTANANYFLQTLMGISIIWAIFNLFPVLPLDGGRMVESLLGPKRIKITLRISMIVAGLMAVLGLFGGAFFITIIMGMFAYQSFKALQQISWR